MRDTIRIFAGLCLVATLLVAGCKAPGLAEKVEQVRGYVQGKCGFIPTVASITDVLLSAGGAAVAVGAMGEAVCNALAKPSSAMKTLADVATDCKAVVNDVCIEGEWAEADGR